MMIVFCEECGGKNELDSPAEIIADLKKFRCQFCDETLRITPAQYLMTRLRLTFKDQIVEIDQNRSVATLGRKSDSDIVLHDKTVSRLHAFVLYKDNQFVLIDQSTNGTYIQDNGNENIQVKKKEYELKGKGKISPARKVEPDSPNLIEYQILEQKPWEV